MIPTALRDFSHLAVVTSLNLVMLVDYDAVDAYHIWGLERSGSKNISRESDVTL